MPRGSGTQECEALWEEGLGDRKGRTTSVNPLPAGSSGTRKGGTNKNELEPKSAVVTRCGD